MANPNGTGSGLKILALASSTLARGTNRKEDDMKVFQFPNIVLVRDEKDPTKYECFNRDGTDYDWVEKMSEAMENATGKVKK